MEFQFATAQQILFGPGTLKQAAPLASAYGRVALVVTGANPERARTFIEMLRANDVGAEVLPIAGEPTIAAVVAGAELAQSKSCEVVIGFGGGSAMDAAKAIAALATNPGDPLDYLEVVGKGQPLTQPPLPCVAIATTAGTGAEVTRNAVLASPEHKVKVSLRHALMLPRLAVVDPELTYALPPDITASTGLDALTQLIEPYTCCRANPLTDGYCLEGLSRVSRSLRRAYEDEIAPIARENMALASLLGGLSLANSGLGAVHGFAGPLGGMFGAPHGAICAALLPHVMRANVKVLREEDSESDYLGRYRTIAHLLCCDAGASIEDGIAWVAELVDALNIPSLGAHGITEADFPAIVAKSQKASSMKANPVELTTEELTGILKAAL